jgi:predicted DNA-binding transcriptional regulator AlpA
MTDMPTVFAGSEAARLLGLSHSTLAKLRLSGNGPLYCKLGRRVVYRLEDLKAWLEARTTSNTSDADFRLPRSLTGQQAGSVMAGICHTNSPADVSSNRRSGRSPQPSSGLER